MREKKIYKGVRINKEILDKINQILTTSNFNFSEFVNSALYYFLENKKNKKDEISKLEFYNIYDKFEKDIRIKFPKQEYEILEILAKAHGFNSVNKEVKFLLINFTHDEKLFNNVEMKELKNSITDINKLGRNLNEILKEYKKARYPFGYDKLIKDELLNSEILTNIQTQIQEITQLISDYEKILNYHRI